MIETKSTRASHQRLHLTVVCGTRPEAIKMAPIILAARARPELDVQLCATGQHRQMLDETLKVFDLRPDVDLEIMRPNQTLEDVTQLTLKGMEGVLKARPCDWLLVQGDTTSAFAASLAGFYAKVRVAHIEAGLRTNNKQQPWPEEVNRRLISAVADRHYAPTDMARDNLLREGHNKDDIIVTGNTVLDALLMISTRLEREPALRAEFEQRFAWLGDNRRTILVTGHRRESFGQGFHNICDALAQLARRSDIQIVYPVHLNPNVREPVMQRLSGLSNVHLIEPVDYLTLVFLLKRCHFVLTDSGGIQEEAPSLGKPVLVMRATSERMEAVHAGLAKLVGVDAAVICKEAERLLDDADAYEAMRNRPNPFGDGRAAVRIVDDLLSAGLTT